MSYVGGRAIAGRFGAERLHSFSWTSAAPPLADAAADPRSMARGLAWALAIAVTFWGLLAVLFWAT